MAEKPLNSAMARKLQSLGFMKLPLISALALICFVTYLNATRRDAFAVSGAHLDGYSSVSIVESSQDNADLYFAFRAARGDGMSASGVRVRG